MNLDVMRSKVKRMAVAGSQTQDTSGLSCQCSANHSSQQDCEGWWLSDCCGSVAEHWQLKQEVS